MGAFIISNSDFIESRFSGTIGVHVAIVDSEFEGGFGSLGVTILVGFIGFNTGEFAHEWLHF